MPADEIAVFGETRDAEEAYLYELHGSADLLQIYVTDMQQRGWVGEFKLQDLKETVSDISPEDSQMHDWIVTAARSKKFSIVLEGGLAHLEATINAGGFAIDIRSGCRQRTTWRTQEMT
ncbi:hypothetical protein ABBQ32_004896 [Trebouxia sp. C0010 RCD-2024]